VRWETLISLATLLLAMAGMWWVHEQEQIVDAERIRIMIQDVQEIRSELVEIERRLPR
jgi:hypothetical protein